MEQLLLVASLQTSNEENDIQGFQQTWKTCSFIV